MNFPGIQFTIVYAFATLVFFITAVAVKRYRTLFCISGLTMLGGTVLCAVNLWLRSERMFLVSAALPIGFLMIVLGMNSIISYTRCTEAITAECVGFETGHRRMIEWVYPKFRYRYNGKIYVSLSFVSYSVSQYKAMFEGEKKLTVYVNPDKPVRCVDKRTSPLALAITGSAIGCVMILVAVLVCVL